ncbi:MAG: hypothetical protein AB1420_12975 [Bacillota bacterium]
MVAASGKKLIASGCYVDENGNVNSWSMSTFTMGKPGEDEKKELLEGMAFLLGGCDCLKAGKVR